MIILEENFKIASPISNFFRNKELARQIKSFSDVLELRDNSIEFENDIPLIYHSELNILAKWKHSDINKLKKLNSKYNFLSISYHLASRYQNNLLKDNKFIGIGKPLSISEMKKNVRENIRITKDIFGHDKIIMVENINNLLTDAYDIITSADFISNII